MRLTQRNRQFLVSGLLILVLLLALGLRLYRIQAQSLWNDEGTSLALAARDLGAITRAAAKDIHPPLYHYLLHFWMAFFGSSESAVRSLSALLGTSVVLLTFVLGRSVAASRRFDRAGNRVALLAAFFAALSPFQIYYSQEARMYILSTLLGAASMYAFLCLLSRWQNEVVHTNTATSFADRYLAVTAYVIVTTLLLYTHYFAVTIIVAQNLAFLWWLRRERSTVATYRLPVALRWAVLQAIIAVSYLPWLFLAREQLRVWPAISEPLRLATLALDLLRVFSLGLSVEPRPSLALAGFASLLLLGILTLHSYPREQSRTAECQMPASMPYVTSLLYLFVPISMMYVLSLQRPMYNPKFVLLCTPPFYLFLAQGILSLAGRQGRAWQSTRTPNSAAGSRETPVWPWLRIAASLIAIVFIAGSSLYSLRAYYFDSRYARDDYRGIAQYVHAVERADDAVLINAPGQIETFTYYYQGKLSLYPLPRQRPLDEVQTEADLRQMIKGRKRIFAVLWATDESDPRRFVEGWLDQHTYKAMDSWHGNVRLVVYAVPAQPAAEGIDHPLDVNLGDKVRLLGYSLPTTELMPGDILQLTLFWQAVAPMNERYKVFTHVADAHGHLVGQRDAEPGGGAKITTIWREGEQVVDNYGLLILPATPPGDYIIEIGMYGLGDGLRLPVIEGDGSVGDHVILQSVRILPAVAPPPLSVLGMKAQLDAQFEDVTLLGYDLAKLGFEHQPDAPIRAGDILHLTLFWQANNRLDSGIALALQLKDEKGAIWLERRGQPTEGQYPTQQWSVGEIVRDQHNWPLPADLPTGRYRAYLSVQRLPSGQQMGPLLPLASLAISD
jgi:mannosyltransferase